MKVAAPGCAGRVLGCAAAIFVATTFSRASRVTSVSAAISSSSGLARSYNPHANRCSVPLHVSTTSTQKHLRHSKVLAIPSCHKIELHAPSLETSSNIETVSPTQD